jgi:hypothetical protein
MLSFRSSLLSVFGVDAHGVVTAAGSGLALGPIGAEAHAMMRQIVAVLRLAALVATGLSIVITSSVGMAAESAWGKV